MLRQKQTRKPPCPCGVKRANYKTTDGKSLCSRCLSKTWCAKCEAHFYAIHDCEQVSVMRASGTFVDHS